MNFGQKKSSPKGKLNCETILFTASLRQYKLHQVQRVGYLDPSQSEKKSSGHPQLYYDRYIQTGMECKELFEKLKAKAKTHNYFLRNIAMSAPHLVMAKSGQSGLMQLGLSLP